MHCIARPSANCDSREGHPVDMLVLHYTGMPTAEEALARLCDPAAKVSAHYVVEESGQVLWLVEEKDRAWHAGVSHWRGAANINQRSIGIEIVNPGHEFGYRPFPQAQMAAVAELCRAILGRHAIPARNVVAHSDIAPARKKDPGERFDWPFLAGQGIGLWPQASAPAPVSAIAETQRKLLEYGYDCPQSGVWDEPSRKVAVAFQRHYRPANLSGQWGGECAALLADLLQQAYNR